MKSFIILALIPIAAMCTSSFVGPMRNFRDAEGLGHVERHGMLRAVNGKIVNKYGNIAQSNGMALFWSQWAAEFWNADVVNWLVSDWNIKLLRCSMAASQGGYVDNPDGETAKLTTVVDAAISNSIYAIIDWHIEGANSQFKDQAKVFFDHMSAKYGSNDHVVYEGWNEPTDQDWSGELKGYHQEVLGTIRAHTNNLYIAGNPQWSSQPNVACNDRLDDGNVAYTMHFYAATHYGDVRDRAQEAINNGCAVVITEWGTCESSGDGNVDENSANEWLSWAESNGVSTANWSINDKSESCSALNPGASHNGGWSEGDLTQSGRFVRNHMKGGQPGPNPDPNPGPTPSGDGCCTWNDHCREDQRGDYCDQSQANCSSCGGNWINA